MGINFFILSNAERAEQAPHLPHPALILSAPIPDAWIISARGPRIECINVGDGGEWLSSGVPVTGTKGTTKGYTPIEVSFSQTR